MSGTGQAPGARSQIPRSPGLDPSGTPRYSPSYPTHGNTIGSSQSSEYLNGASSTVRYFYLFLSCGLLPTSLTILFTQLLAISSLLHSTSLLITLILTHNLLDFASQHMTLLCRLWM